MPTIILSSSLYSFALTSLWIVVYLVFGALAFGLNIGASNVVGAFIILLLTVICSSSIGILSASFIMVLKKGDPFSWIFKSLSWLLSGVYHPVSILPNWLQKSSYLIPITHSLEGMRMALLKGCSFKGLLPRLLPLLVFTGILMPTSNFVFKYALKIAKINGSLTQY